ncbi:MAG: hypothetical protein EOO38_05195 [Cytophagaceae bacterium]|nr:MAG: hypothetical protein EOO38_05195 [Cytophagaceae bacterium]
MRSFWPTSPACARSSSCQSRQNMLFARCAQVTPADLAAARQAAVSAMQDPGQVAAYLQASALWQHHLRQQAEKQWSWESLAPKPWPNDLNPDQLQCGITFGDFADLAQPVLCPSGTTWRIYEAKDLLTHWVAHGTDIFNQKLELDALRRPPVPAGNAPTKDNE